MIGRAPVMNAPVFVQPAVVQPRPAAAPMPQQRPLQPTAGNPPAPQPRARAKFDELQPPPPMNAALPASVSAPVQPLGMPSPEALGIGSPRADEAPADWNAAHARLRRLGVVGIQTFKSNTGGYRVTFVMPAGQPDRTHFIEATAASEAEAVALALGRAEEWAARGK